MKDITMKKTAYMSVLLVFIFSNSLFAHPGHEHSATGSGLVNLFWLVPVIVVAVVVVFKEITAPKN